MMLPMRWNWHKLFSYGEVVFFISAWAIGLSIAMQEQRADETRASVARVNAASDTLGIQATLTR